MIVDVDTHWEIGRLEPSEHPLGPWLDELPFGLDLLANAIAGDVLAAMGVVERPSPADLLSDLVASAKTAGNRPAIHPSHDSGAAERIDWMDDVGIDHCLVNPGGYWQQIPFVSDRPAAIRRCNDFLSDALSDGEGRLHAVAVLDWESPRRAVEELTHARERGARAFFLQTVSGRPAGGSSPGHPEWDPLWAAAVDHGMVGVIHVGNTSSNFDGWADIGWDHERGAGTPALTRLGNTQRIHAAQNLISGLLYGGAFARYPALSVVVEEMRAGWFPSFVAMLAGQSRPSPFLGDWPWDRSGEEMLRDSVKLTPLPGFGDSDALEVLESLPEMVVFSSDYPHHEGNADPIGIYQPELGGLAPEVSTAFLGETVRGCFDRTGVPL